VDDVEVLRVAEDAPELAAEAGGEHLAALRVQPQRVLGDGDQARRRLRVAAGEQRHVVTSPDELLGKVRDDTLGAAIEARGDRLIERRDLGDPHDRRSSLQTQRH